MRWLLYLTGLLCVGVVLSATSLARSSAEESEPVTDRLMSIRGVTFAHVHQRGRGYGSEPARAELDKMQELGVNWIALCDFAYMPDVNRPQVGFGRDSTMRRHDIGQQIEDARERGIDVLLKPHIWANSFYRGKWHGDIAMNSEEDWARFFDNYTKYIVDQAKIAQEFGAGGLSIGVEMKGVSHRDAEWRALIAEVRAVYDGPITYSANSDEWQAITWWDAVDVIGITAYWPLADEDFAERGALREGWAKALASLDELHRRTGKPIVFTELGFSASADAAREPWKHDERDSDIEFQARLYDVALEEIAKRDYLAGVFIWKWMTVDIDGSIGRTREAFVVQNRAPVLEAFRENFTE